MPVILPYFPIQCEIFTPALPNAATGTAYSATVQAYGGAGPPYTWQILSDLPDTGNWLSINPTSGVLSGVPTTAETETVTVVAKDFVGTPGVPKTFTLTVNAASVGPAAMWPGYQNSSSVAFSWWPPSSGSADYYKVYRNGTLLYGDGVGGAPNPGGVTPSGNIGGPGSSIPQPFYIDGTGSVPLAANATNTYTVTAVLSGVESAPGPSLSMTTLAGATATTPPTAPTDPATWIQAFALPAATPVICNNAADLTNALANANINGPNLIVLTAGNTFIAPSSGFNIPAFTGTGGWTYIISSQTPVYNASGTLPAYSYSTAQGAGANSSGVGGNWVTPGNAASMPTIQIDATHWPSFNFLQNATAAPNKVRFVGINIVPTGGTGIGASSPRVPQGLTTSASTYLPTPQNGTYTPFQLPDSIYFDRCMEGNDSTAANFTYLTHGMFLNGTHVLVHQCYFWGMNDNQGSGGNAGGDSQCIYMAQGRYVCMQNSFFEAGAEGFLAGGVYVDQALQPQDVVYRYNYNQKNPTWVNNLLGSGTKNHFELKTGIRVECYGNIHVNNWRGPASQGQGNWSFAIAARDQMANTGGTPITHCCPWVTVTDVNIHDNQMWNVAAIAEAFTADHSASSATARIRFANNDLLSNPPTGSQSTAMLDLMFSLQGPVSDVIFDHQTLIKNSASSVWQAGGINTVFYGNAAPNSGAPNSPNPFPRAADRWTLTNCVLDSGNVVAGDSLANGGLATLNAMFTNLTYTNNLTTGDSQAGYPGTNFPQVLLGNIGFAAPVSETTIPSPPANWNIVSGTYATAATGGSALGATFPGISVPSYTPNKVVIHGLAGVTTNYVTTDGFTVTAYPTFATALAAQQPGDFIRVEKGLDAGSTGASAASPYVYREQLNFKGATNGTAASPVTWFARSGHYLQIYMTLGFIQTAYTVAGSGSPNGAWLAQAGFWGQGLIHFEGNSYINCDFRDSTGQAQALQIADAVKDNWNPVGTASVPANPFTYVNHHNLSIVSSNNCQVRGVHIQGATSYYAGYAGWDCFNLLFDWCWWDKHGTNNFGNSNGQATGEIFDFYGHDSLFQYCKGTYCGHNSGPAINGFNNHARYCDWYSDWTAYNTGASRDYAGNCFAGFLQGYVPLLPTPPPTGCTIGPVLFEYCRFVGCSPGDVAAGTPYQGFFTANCIVRNCVYAGGLAGGHNITEMNVGNGSDTHTMLLVGQNMFYNNSSLNTPFIDDSLDTGFTAAAHPKSYGGNRWQNNVYDGIVNNGLQRYLIYNAQSTSQCGNNPYPRNNKGNQVFSNCINGTTATTDSGGRVISRTMNFWAYNNGASTTFCDWTDAGGPGGTTGASTAFPGDMSGNIIQQPVWTNSSAALQGGPTTGLVLADLQAALNGMTLAASSNGNMIGTANPPVTVATAASNVTQISVTPAPQMFYDGRNCTFDTPDSVAIVPSGGGNANIVQLVRGTGVDVAGSHLNLQKSVTVGVGDKIYFVSRTGSACTNWGQQ